MVVYRYTDMDDDIIKYVGIVWGKSATLDGRVAAHKKDWWYPNHEWKIEYFEIDMDSRTDAEYLEAHLISLYKSDLYYNVAKSGWGISSFIPDVEDRWIEYGVFESDIIEPPDSEKIRKLKQINAKLRLENKQIKKRARDIYTNRLRELDNAKEEYDYLKECIDIYKDKVSDLKKEIDDLQVIKEKVQNRHIELVSKVEMTDCYELTVDDIIAIYRFCNRDDLTFESKCFDENGDILGICKIFKNGDEICYSMSTKYKNIECERLYPERESDHCLKAAIDSQYCMIMGQFFFTPSDDIAYVYLLETYKQCIESNKILYHKDYSFRKVEPQIEQFKQKYEKLSSVMKL